MPCSVLIDLSFFVAKEGLHKEEPLVFGNRHEFFNSDPFIFKPCKMYHNRIMILILILILMITKYYNCIMILILILILMITKYHNCIMILILILILMITKYHNCIMILILILILMVIITFIIRKYVKILLDSI